MTERPNLLAGADADREEIRQAMRAAAREAQRERIEREAAERWEAVMPPLVEALEPGGREFTTTVRVCACGRHFAQGEIVELECCSACSRDMLPSRNPLLSPYDEVEAMARAKLAIKRSDDSFRFTDGWRGRQLPQTQSERWFNHIDTENIILEELGFA